MRAKIIAEASSNHGGNIETAKRMIRTAAEYGVDYIKFQSWQAKNLRSGDPNYERHRKTELSDEDHYVLMDECKKSGIEFLTSCFDMHRVDFLAGLGLESIKVPSTEFSSLTMIKKLRDKFPHLILSTGAITEKELQETLRVLQGSRFTLLHCMSIYPLPPEKANLNRMKRLRRYAESVGFSDHSLGAELSKAAIAMGAEYIEKHFTIDKSLPGKDQAMSAELDIIKEIVDYAKYIDRVTGKEQYELFQEELEVRKQYIGKWGDNR